MRVLGIIAAATTVGASLVVAAQYGAGLLPLIAAFGAIAFALRWREAAMVTWGLLLGGTSLWTANFVAWGGAGEPDGGLLVLVSSVTAQLFLATALSAAALDVSRAPTTPGSEPPQAMARSAVAALVLALTFPPAGVLCGHAALARIRATGERGYGTATAALGLAYVGSAVALFVCAAVLLAIVQ